MAELPDDDYEETGSNSDNDSDVEVEEEEYDEYNIKKKIVNKPKIKILGEVNSDDEDVVEYSDEEDDTEYEKTFDSVAEYPENLYGNDKYKLKTATEEDDDDDARRQKKRLIGIRDDSDNDSDNDSDDDDSDGENYLRKFDESMKSNVIEKHHPELIMHNHQEVEALCRIVRDENGNIVDPLHRTMPFLTKFEKARILGERAKQINAGAQSMVPIPDEMIDGYLIALKEYEERKLPMILRRPLPNGGCEYWKFADLEII